MTWPVPSLRPNLPLSQRPAPVTVSQESLLSSSIKPRRVGGLFPPRFSQPSVSRPHVAVHQFGTSSAPEAAVNLSYNRSGKGHQRDESQRAGPGAVWQDLVQGSSMPGGKQGSCRMSPCAQLAEYGHCYQDEQGRRLWEPFPRCLGDLSLARKCGTVGWGAPAEVWRCWEVRVEQGQPCDMVVCMSHGCQDSGSGLL